MDGDPSYTDSIFALWAEDDGCRNLHLQDKGMVFDESKAVRVYYHRYLETLEQCDIEVTISGDNQSGSYIFNSSVYVEGTGKGIDPGCNDINTTGLYHRHGIELLTMESSSGAVMEYHNCSDLPGCAPAICGIL